jgi:hypothetical protein
MVSQFFKCGRSAILENKLQNVISKLTIPAIHGNLPVRTVDLNCDIISRSALRGVEQVMFIKILFMRICAKSDDLSWRADSARSGH